MLINYIKAIDIVNQLQTIPRNNKASKYDIRTRINNKNTLEESTVVRIKRKVRILRLRTKSSKVVY